MVSDTSDGCDVSIRPATYADVEAVSRLVSDLSRRFITPDYTSQGAQALLSRQTPEAIAKCLAEGMHYLVAESIDTLVGVGGLIREQRHLYHLFVDAARHRQGIARRLWNELTAGLAPGPITVNSSKAAIGFYERLGFRANGPAWEKTGVVAWPMIWQPSPSETPAGGGNLSSS